MSAGSTEAGQVVTQGVRTTVATGGNSSDVSVIITVAACIGGLFLVVLIVFIIFVIYFYRKEPKEDEFTKKRPSIRADRLDWKSHSLAHQFGDINDVDEVLWAGRGRTADQNTDNPAFGKDFEPLDVNKLQAQFDSADDDAMSTQETESSNDLMVEIKMDDEDNGADSAAEAENEAKKQISILDMKTWGQPGTSRHNSMRAPYGFDPPPEFAPRSPDAISNGRQSLRSQNGNPFPYAGYGRRDSQGVPPGGGDFPFTVSQPSNDPRFQYTRTNPLVADVNPSNIDRYGPSDRRNGRYTAHDQRDFGGMDDIEFDRSSTLRNSRRNQSIVDFYESGSRNTGSSFNLALEGSGSVGKNLLWQNKSFQGIGFANTK